MVERARRLRVRPSQPDLRGPRETLPGPTTWVRPATGWWERMNAGETPRNQGLSVKGAPVRFQKAVSRSKENAAVERREANALRHWACAARRSNVTPRLSALRSLTFGGGDSPLMSEGMEMTGAPRALREQGRRSFGVLLAGCLKCESASDIAHDPATASLPVFGEGGRAEAHKRVHARL